MYSVLIAIHLIVSVIMILVIILQSGKGSEMGAVFGGGSSQTAFGSQGAAGFLEKTTVVCAVIFMLTSLSLAVLSSNRQRSLIQDVTPQSGEQAASPKMPAQPSPSAKPESQPGQPAAPSPKQSSAPMQIPAPSPQQPAAPIQQTPATAPQQQGK